jgi:methionyl-tRNA formyltransferase
MRYNQIMDKENEKKLSKPIKIFFFGNEQIAQGIKQKSTPVFDFFAQNPNFDVKAVILTSQNKRRKFPIETQAIKYNIPIYYNLKTSELIKLIEKEQPIIGILAAYGKIVSEKVINAFSKGILNIHPSLLPQYRGTTPIESAILNGDTTIGTSIMLLASEMDAGPILAQAKIQIKPNATKDEIYQLLIHKSLELIQENISSYLKNENKLIIQNHEKATFTKKLQKSDAFLKPEQESAEILERKVRAYAGFPKARTIIQEIPCIITKAHVAIKPNSNTDLLCSDGKYLVLDEIIPENSKPMSVQAFLNGLKNKK